MIWSDLAARWHADPGVKVVVLTAAALLVSVPASIFAARQLEKKAPDQPGKPGPKCPHSSGE